MGFSKPSRSQHEREIAIAIAGGQRPAGCCDTTRHAPLATRHTSPATSRGPLAPGYFPARCASLPSNPQSLIPNPSAGFTLIEMLIVITIMMMLVAAAATMMRPDIEGRRIREAARAINVYFSSARNRAMETGRPCGVLVRLFPPLKDGGGNPIPPFFAMYLDQCEVPPCYCGETEQSTASVTCSGVGGTVTVTLSDGAPPAKMVFLNDSIQFNSQGPLYTILSANAYDLTDKYVTGNTLTLTYDDTQYAVPWTTTAQSVPYRIYRAPIKGAATPLQLPSATVIDMGASGVSDGAVAASNGDIVILFGPNGAVIYLSIGGTQTFPTSFIFLLVGKRERVTNDFVPNEANPTKQTNYQDLSNMWVIINPQTGLVTTEPVAAIPASVTTAADAVIAARELARQAQGMGGK